MHDRPNQFKRFQLRLSYDYYTESTKNIITPAAMRLHGSSLKIRCFSLLSLILLLLLLLLFFLPSIDIFRGSLESETYKIGYRSSVPAVRGWQGIM